MDITQNYKNNLSIDIQNNLKIISTNANRLGFNVYLVGGVVRDLILNKKIMDVDILCDLDSTILAKKLEEQDICKIKELKKEFRTAKIVVNGMCFDFATTRCEIYQKSGCLPQIVDYGVNLFEDSKRRDFTINTLVLSLNKDNFLQIIDPSEKGLEDLKNKTLRILHDKSFVDDPTRILRMLKFMFRFDFKPDTCTFNLMSDYLKKPNYDVCYYRIKSEFMQTFNLNKSEILDFFLKNNIYKLFTKNIIQNINSTKVQKIIAKYKKQIKQIYSIYLGVLIENENYEKLPFNFTVYEKKTFSDIIKIFETNTNIKNKYQIYHLFKDKNIEAIIVYYLKTNDNNAIEYLDKLKDVKLSITGKDLLKLGIKEGKVFKTVFDEVLKEKLSNPNIKKEKELQIVTKILAKKNF